jgi:radical SAM protein with 4Fe4S-binding SPASM domain
MKSSSSDERSYFCTEPWIGSFAVKTDGDVHFCPCYLDLRIGNLGEASIQEIWNCDELVEMRRDFAEGRLPERCQGKLCPPALGRDDNP